MGGGSDDDEGRRRCFIEGEHWGLPLSARRSALRAGEIDFGGREGDDPPTPTGFELGCKAKGVRPMGHKGARLATSGKTG
jgi:hypothetical protein